MFGSQALETAIGLALLFFVLATLASGITETISRILRKRARDLEITLGQMLTGRPALDPDTRAVWTAFTRTQVYRSASLAAGQGRRWVQNDVGPAYLSAKAFAEAIDQMPEAALAPVNEWLAGFKAGGRRLSLEARATIESWYDDTMDRLSGAYKRWATSVLFVVGLAIAAGFNVSAMHAAQTLWEQPAVRQAALGAAGQAAARSGTASTAVTDSVTAVQSLPGLGLPVGWQQPVHWHDGLWTVTEIAGWLVTALLLMLGAPFWFDLLSRMVSLRVTGAKPRPAAQDPAAAVAIRASIAPEARPAPPS